MKYVFTVLFLIMCFNLKAHDRLHFAPTGMYGKYRTKQCKIKGKHYTYQKHKYHTKKCKLKKQREAWIYRQWTRN